MEKGKLPDGWEMKTLGEVCEIIGGGTPSKKREDFYNGNILWATVRDMKGNNIKNTEHKITPNAVKNSATNIIPKGNVIVATRVGLGKVCILENDTAINQDLKGVIPKNKKTLSIPFLFRWFTTISDKIVNAGTGATVQGVKLTFVNSLSIPIPSLNKQKQIVAILDKAFSAIDTAKVNAEKNLKNAKELFESYLQGVFDPSTRSGKDWEEKTLGECGLVQTGTTPKTSEKENYDSYIPFAKPPHFKKNGEVDTKESYLSKIGMRKSRVFPSNSILMVCIGATIGKTGFSKKAITSNQQINGLTTYDRYYPRFFYYLLISEYVQKQIMSIGKSAQATLPIINKTKWSNINLMFPSSIEEQKKIVQKLDALSAETKKLEAIYTQKIADLEEMKKSILQKAFRGELSVL